MNHRIGVRDAWNQASFCFPREAGPIEETTLASLFPREIFECVPGFGNCCQDNNAIQVGRVA
jgi:hypothetical protein